MSHKIVISHISHWHEHAIHEALTAILGYDSWPLGKATYSFGRAPNEEIDLLLEFPAREDYEHTVIAIGAIRQRMPPA